MRARRQKDGYRQIGVREANQGFSKLIARVEQGARFVVTKNSKAVAQITPVEDSEAAKAARQKAAMGRLRALMASGRKSEDGWTFKGARETLHDRDR